MRVIIVDSKNISQVIEIDENKYVRDLMDKIKEEKGINGKIILHFNAEILEENETISFYEIKENSHIIYMGEFRGG